MIKVLCSAPFNSLTINPDKSVVPCCAWDNYNSKSLGNLNDLSLSEILNGTMLKEVQQDMLNFRWHNGCLICKNKELDAGTSTRTHLYNALVPYDNNNKIKWLEFNTSNTCNLACITCGPFYSSYWEDYVRNNDKASKTYNIIKDASKINPDFYKHIDYSNLTILVLKGGEPFLNIHVMDLLIYLEEIGVLKKITLEIVTNGTVYDKKLFQYLEKAKHLKISISIDAYGELNQWIRYSTNGAANLEKIYNNIRILLELKNCNYCDLAAVVSAYNIFYLRELQEWWNNNILILSKVVVPVYYKNFINNSQIQCPLVLTQKTLDLLFEYYYSLNDAAYDTILIMLNNKYLGNEKHNKFVDFSLMHNKKRHIDLLTVAPKLKDELVYIND